MALIVQKYGGSSVADANRLRAVAQRVQRTVAEHHRVVVVVSAMGKTTDGLIRLAGEVTAAGAESLEGYAARQRELDLLLATGEQASMALLSLCLQSLGQPAIAMAGYQVRVVTEPEHGRARILYVETDRLQAALAEGKVVVVAGFQGVALDPRTQAPTAEVTTLGRGGSDTSAVAIAAALEADLCEIYTDVPGILTTDPRIVPNAQLLGEVTCDEMLELASQGAKVLHPRAVEIARNFGVRLAVRSSWLDDPGTIVLSPALCAGDRRALEVNRFVEGVLCDRDRAKIALVRVPDRPGIAAQLFRALAARGIVVDLIVQGIHASGDTTDIAFTVPRADLEGAAAVARGLDLGAREVVLDPAIAQVSIVGVGIVGRPSIPAQMFSVLGQAGINLQMISTSELKVSCVVADGEADRAIAALTQAFGVAQLVADPTAARADGSAPVRGVALDRNRARLAVLEVPDRPGQAAVLLERLAGQGIPIDTIVQSHPDTDAQVNDITFTVPQTDAATAATMLRDAAATLPCGEIVADGAIAKVSIVGAGMIRQPGVAARMFEALAEANINIEAIATSEIKVTCIVREQYAELALKTIHQAFQLGGDRAVTVAGTPAGQVPAKG